MDNLIGSALMIEADKILIESYTYPLSPERIAHFPLLKRDESKLLVYKSGRITEDLFQKIYSHLPAGATLILNNTRVIEARLVFKKSTGGSIEIFCLEPFEKSMEEALQSPGVCKWKCLVGGASKWKRGQILLKEIEIAGSNVQLKATYLSKSDDGFIVEFTWSPPEFYFVQVIHAAGAIPLPPYIKRSANEIDTERYQTIFSKHEGSVAAPTAALHFTEQVFSDLQASNILTEFITLNVGAGTFKPVKTPSVADHHMHGEHFSITKDVLKTLLGSEVIVAVGTTSLRTIESIHWLGVKLLNGTLNEWILDQWEVYTLDNSISYKQSIEAVIGWMDERNVNQLNCCTSLLIVPGYHFNVPAALITNFHQPQSTLLLLIAAFIGEDWRKVYTHALENDYRFLSYGDSSLLWRQGL